LRRREKGKRQRSIAIPSKKKERDSAETTKERGKRKINIINVRVE